MSSVARSGTCTKTRFRPVSRDSSRGAPRFVALNDCFEKFRFFRLPVQKQKAALYVPFKVFTSEDRYTNQQRRSALERVCLTLLRAAKVTVLQEFFVENIRDIMAIVEAKPSKVRRQIEAVTIF